jgi:hypothetical protein
LRFPAPGVWIANEKPPILNLDIIVENGVGRGVYFGDKTVFGREQSRDNASHRARQLGKCLYFTLLFVIMDDRELTMNFFDMDSEIYKLRAEKVRPRRSSPRLSALRLRKPSSPASSRGHCHIDQE